MSKQAAIIIMLIVFILGSVALLFLVFNSNNIRVKVDVPSVNEPVVELNEEGKEALTKEEKRRALLEKLNAEKEEEIYTPLQKQILRERMLDELNAKKEEENVPQMTSEEKEAERKQILDILNDKKE